MTPASLAAYIHERLAELHDPVFAEGQRRFFQHEVNTYGVRGPDLKRLSAEVYRAVKGWAPRERMRLMELLWRTGKLEGGAIVCYVLRRFIRSFGEEEFRQFERWVDRYVRNWAHTDGVASWLLAACIANQPDLRFRLTKWTSSKNRWKRRASAVSLLQEAKAGRNTEFIFSIAACLLPDRDDMVEKGVGWLLKQTYPKRPRETVEFLLKQGTAASRLTLRYAAEKMTTADRAAVLRSGISVQAR
jgi:3-methyladenine DNA glycosylase AlkD